MIRILATLLGLAALGVAMVGLGARYLPLNGHPTVVLAVQPPTW